MKIRNSRKNGGASSAFTLMELLIVISLIAVLAGMVLAAMPAIIGKVKRDQARLVVQELEAGLSAYKLDNGWYPIHRENSEEGGFVLYKHLSGDFDEDGVLDDVSDETKIYVEAIDWNTAKNQSQQRVGKLGDRYALVDPFGSPIRYLCEPPGAKNKKTKNPTFDIWSLGGADSESTAIKERSKWLTNWE